jgi:putative glutamine amidotransferase
MRAAPLVGVTWTADIVQRSRGPGENLLRYAAFLVDAGMTPVVLTPGSSNRALARLDGLLIPGGPDMAPSSYGRQPTSSLGPVAPELDALELDLVHAARSRGMPIIGICRGQQVLNVALGGTLHQHVDHPQWDEDHPSQPVHDITIAAGTHLHRTLGVGVARVNSGHHQAVDDVAPSLTVSARSEDGCVEGLEAEALLVTAVQWHPDEMPADPLTGRLAAGFAAWLGMAAAPANP